MNKQAVLTLRSLTAALKAKRILEANGFTVKMTKISEKDGTGCRYGITVSNGELRLAADILNQNGITADA